MVAVHTIVSPLLNWGDLNLASSPGLPLLAPPLGKIRGGARRGRPGDEANLNFHGMEQEQRQHVLDLYIIIQSYPDSPLMGTSYQDDLVLLNLHLEPACKLGCALIKVVLCACVNYISCSAI